MRQLPFSVADMQSDGRRGAELHRKSLWLEQPAVGSPSACSRLAGGTSYPAKNGLIGFARTLDPDGTRAVFVVNRNGLGSVS
jgi:hypothetical protein